MATTLTLTPLCKRCLRLKYYYNHKGGLIRTIFLKTQPLQKELFTNNPSMNKYMLSRFFSTKAKKGPPIPAFVDFFQLQANGGGGGQGLPKFGGFGGDGGNVIIVATSKVRNLRQVWQKYPTLYCKAGQGDNSNKFHLLGKNGKNLHILVPEGIIVHKSNGEIIDLNKEGDKCLISTGGVGGNDKTSFLGRKGESNATGLELKLLADVGLVGFPNAGKSTLLRAFSRAKPKVAPLPFTTIAPKLGIMEFEDGRRISVADLPGLIEGAHQNIGMGFKFLRHVERTKLLLYVIDINKFQLSSDHPERTPFETLLLLIKELEEYGHGMLDKPSILTLNKSDTDGYGKKIPRLLDLVNNLPDSLDTVAENMRPNQLPTFDAILPMSGKTRANTETVMKTIRDVMDIHADRRLQQELETEKSPLMGDMEERMTTKLV